MPACITHSCFAKAVLKALPKKLGEGLNECAYIWGAQGPDFFFCHRYFPWMKGKSLKKIGSDLHKIRPSVVLDAMRKFLATHEDPIYRSYVFGFMCHYALDSTAHPYVNALSRALVEQRPYETVGTMHGEIEAALDAIILRRETGKLPSSLSLGQMFPKNETVQRRIAHLYYHVLFAVFHCEIAEEEIFRATKDAHFVFSCLTDRSGIKKLFFDAMEKGKPHYVSSHIVPLTETADIDYANVGNSPWQAEGTVHEEDFFQLFEQARELAETLIRQWSTGDFSEITQEKPFG